MEKFIKILKFIGKILIAISAGFAGATIEGCTLNTEVRSDSNAVAVSHSASDTAKVVTPYGAY